MDENLIAKIKMMTPEQKASMAQVIQSELASRQAGGMTDTTSRPRGFLPTATSAMENLPNALSVAIRGKPIQEDDMSNKINTLMATEAIKRKYEAEDPLNIAKRQAIEKFSSPDAQTKDDDLWKDIPEEDRQFYRIKKTYQNIDGVPVVIDQEVEETAAGKRMMALREKADEAKMGELKTKRERAEKAIPIVDELLRNQSLKTASGGGALLSAIPGTGWKTAGAKLDQLKGILTLDNLGLMKGVLSDADIRILTNAATSLRQDMSYQDLTRELTTIKETFKKALTEQGNKPAAGQGDERSQAKQVLIGKGYSEQEAEQILGQ